MAISNGQNRDTPVSPFWSLKVTVVFKEASFRTTVSVCENKTIRFLLFQIRGRMLSIEYFINSTLYCMYMFHTECKNA